MSRHVIALEKLIGAQLFERRPHSLVLTKAGQHLLPAVMKSFDRLEYALDDIRNDCAPSLRTLRVQMPPSFAVHLAVPKLRDFRRAAADVEIDLVSPYGVGAPPSDVDVAVVYSKPTVTDLVTDLLLPVNLSMLCHPSVASRHSGKSLAEFIDANELVHVRLTDYLAITCGHSLPNTPISLHSTWNADWCSTLQCLRCNTRSAARVSRWSIITCLGTT